MIRILQLEDDRHSARGMSRARETYSWEWDLASSLEEASLMARTRKYDLLIVDLEVLEFGIRELGAGSRFIRRLANRQLGSLNANTPVIVHTAHLEQLSKGNLREIPTVTEVVQKPENPMHYIFEALYRLAKDKVVVKAWPLTESEDPRKALVCVSQWRPERFHVPLANFDPVCLDRLVEALGPIELSGAADLSAQSVEELCLHDIRLVD